MTYVWQQIAIFDLLLLIYDSKKYVKAVGFWTKILDFLGNGDKVNFSLAWKNRGQRWGYSVSGKKNIKNKRLNIKIVEGGGAEF